MLCFSYHDQHDQSVMGAVDLMPGATGTHGCKKEVDDD